MQKLRKIITIKLPYLAGRFLAYPHVCLVKNVMISDFIFRFLFLSTNRKRFTVTAGNSFADLLLNFLLYKSRKQLGYKSQITKEQYYVGTLNRNYLVDENTHKNVHVRTYFVQKQHVQSGKIFLLYFIKINTEFRK
jgi:hypothetical protein